MYLITAKRCLSQHPRHHLPLVWLPIRGEVRIGESDDAKCEESSRFIVCNEHVWQSPSIIQGSLQY